VYNHQHFVGDGLGDTVDYALKMKRTDNALKLDRMLPANKVSEEQMTASVNFLADFRVRAIIVYPIYSLQHFQQLFNPIAELLPYFQKLPVGISASYSNRG